SSTPTSHATWSNPIAAATPSASGRSTFATRNCIPRQANPCQNCGAFLLAEESVSWCCGNGVRLFAPLPPLPPILGLLALNPRQASEWSRNISKLHHLPQSICSCRVLMNYHLLPVPHAKEVAKVG
ncbi:hypothetical protein T439DRAFT_328027, partial [Meredithblackwellia eburnea MCA 4105]